MHRRGSKRAGCENNSKSKLRKKPNKGLEVERKKGSTTTGS